MEWNKAYFQRVRTFFYKRARDVLFSLVEQQIESASAADDELSSLDAAGASQESSYTLKVHF